RSIHTRLIQVIIGHGFFGEYYSRFVPSEEVGCQCEGSPLQTSRHLLLDCPKLDVPRMHLRKVSKYLLLKDIFGSVKGLRALADFLSKSSAFSK
ncbi:hypothetical protein BDV93DRAFT_404767, partial [Ceratobasidium sp. AG-I]